MASAARPKLDITVLHSPSVGGMAFRKWLRKVALAGLQVVIEADRGYHVGTGEGANAAESVLRRRDKPLQMGLVIADDDTLRRLNREYRGADEVTDVLSFSWDHQGHWEGDDESPPAIAHAADYPPFPVLPEEPVPLGEVVISYSQAQRQAQAHGHATDKELALLIVHGILHLTGCDHVEPSQAAEMRAKEREVLSRLFDGD